MFPNKITCNIPSLSQPLCYRNAFFSVDLLSGICAFPVSHQTMYLLDLKLCTLQAKQVS
jgi:hypothetical protein